jgi:tetratricopeptide (TPR) repeat protein
VKIGRNDPCPCGSQKKYKNCHGAQAAAVPPKRAAAAPAAPKASRAAAIAAAASLNQLAQLMNSGRYADAEAAARTLSAQYPSEGRLWKILGAALTLQGKDALRELQRAAQLLPRDAEVFFHFGNALQDRAQLPAAVECQRRAIALKPDFAQAYDALGTALRDLGQLPDAVAQHRRAIAIQPGLAEAHNHLGMALRGLGQTEEAMSCYRQALALRPAFVAAMGNLANALRDSGQVTEAVATYHRVLQLSPNLAPAHYNLAKALQRLGSVDEALASFRRALELRPQFLEAQVELADMQRDLGQLSEAIDGYQRILARQPAIAEVHNRLGNALLAQGQMQPAISCYRRALELQPNYAEAHTNLSNALRDVGQLREALSSAERAVALKPDLAEAQQNLGIAQLDLLQLNEAEASFRRVLALRPDDARAHAALSMALRKLGRFGEAESSCRRALELQPNNAETLAFLAEFPADRGEFEDAEKLFRQALAVDPKLPEALAGIPRFRKMGSADGEWLAAAESLAAAGLPVRHEINLRFSIGKYFDDLKDYAQAFSNYRRANELNKQYGLQRDVASLRQLIDRKLAYFDAQWLERQSGEGAASDRAVFIVGMPRSGTTLVEQIIAAHPAAFGAGELAFWNMAAASYESAAFGGSSCAGLIASAAASYLRLQQQLAPQALRVVDKMPVNFMHLGLIHAALPNARIIHIRRHPIDTCLSIYFQNFSTALSYGNDLEDLACYYTEYRRLMAHWRVLLPSSALLEIQYESLIQEPELWSRKLVEFTGLSWDPRCLEFHEAGRSVTTASKWQVRQKINTASAGRWHHYEPYIGPLRRLLELPP